MKWIGITGPTGAGKTTALSVLEPLGVALADCDQVYHDLLAHSTPLQNVLIARFGPEILEGTGIDRKKLGAVVFGTPAALADLNTLTHGFVREELERRAQEAQEQGKRAFAVDAIALIESGIGESCCAIVGILAPRQVRIQRIMVREGISEEYATARVDAQKPDSFFYAHCSHILENKGGDLAFRSQAEALFRTLLKESGLLS